MAVSYALTGKAIVLDKCKWKVAGHEVIMVKTAVSKHSSLCYTHSLGLTPSRGQELGSAKPGVLL